MTQPDAAEAARALAAATTIERHDLALVLGSGWRTTIDGLGHVVARTPVADLPGFSAPTVAGHGAEAISIAVGDHHVLAFTGRSHYYESRDAQLVAHAVRTAAAAGCRVAVLTSASGGIREDLAPGDIVVLSDHINLTGASPLVGAEFVDLTDLYSARLRALCHDVDPSLTECVYAGYWGPNYETPAEIRAYRTLGADVVGMSTVLEAIAAHAAGMSVLGLTLVTNRAAGLGGRLDHTEVLEVAAAGAARAGRLLAQVVRRAVAG